MWQYTSAANLASSLPRNSPAFLTPYPFHCALPLLLYLDHIFAGGECAQPSLTTLASSLCLLVALVSAMTLHALYHIQAFSLGSGTFACSPSGDLSDTIGCQFTS